jgi:hypothetical protein
LDAGFILGEGLLRLLGLLLQAPHFGGFGFGIGFDGVMVVPAVDSFDKSVHRDIPHKYLL